MTPASVGSYGSWDTIDFIRNIKPCGFKDGIVTKYIKKKILICMKMELM
ncbi:hypothetical protein KK425_15620 [Clostridioides difficile]|nr:hypothetical protein [Clostridioides difficile]